MWVRLETVLWLHNKFIKCAQLPESLVSAVLIVAK